MSRLPPRSMLPASITFGRRWWRRLVWLLAIVAVATVSVCDRSRHTPARISDETRYHDRSFAVVRVVDGDTLIIDVPDASTAKPVTRIRLWGVDTPELAHGATKAMHFGADAAAFAKQTLEGRSVHIVLSPKRTRGKYGRLLAYVYLERGGRMFNEMLLEGGYAYADLRFAHHYKKRFEAADKRARKAGVGLWAHVTLEQMPAWKQRFERR